MCNGSMEEEFVAYLVGDLELLASTDVARLGDSSLKAGQCPVVQRLLVNMSV